MYSYIVWSVNDPEHLSLKVPNMVFDSNVSVDCVRGKQLHQNRI